MNPKNDEYDKMVKGILENSEKELEEQNVTPSEEHKKIAAAFGESKNLFVLKKGRDKLMSSFIRGDQWISSEFDKYLLKTSMNVLHPLVQTVYSTIINNDYFLKIEDRNIEHYSLTGLLEILLNDSFKKIYDIKETMNDAIMNAIRYGDGYVYFRAENSGKTLSADHIHSSRVILDKDANKLGEASFIGIELNLTEKQAEEMGLSFGAETTPPEGTTGEDVLNQKTKIRVVYKFFFKEDGKVHETFLDQSFNIIKEVKESNFKNFPIAQCGWYYNDDNPYSIGEVELVINEQKNINRIYSAASTSVITSIGSQKIVNTNRIIDTLDIEKKLMDPFAVLLTDGDTRNAVVNIEKVPLPPDTMNLLGTAKGSVENTSGINDAYAGNDYGSLQSNAGVETAISRATLRDTAKFESVEKFHKQVYEIVYDFTINIKKNHKMIIDNIILLESDLDDFFTTKSEDEKSKTKKIENMYKMKRKDFKGNLGIEFSLKDLTLKDFNIKIETVLNLGASEKQQVLNKMMITQAQAIAAGALTEPIITTSEFILESPFISDKTKKLKRIKDGSIISQTEKFIDMSKTIKAIETITNESGGSFTVDTLGKIVKQLVKEQEEGSGPSGNGQIKAPQTKIDNNI